MKPSYNVVKPTLTRTFKDQFEAWDFFHREILVNSNVYLWAKLSGRFIYIVHV